jgi:hypothetical protein
METSYLTEKSLGIYLNQIFKRDFVHNKKVPQSTILNRPDYRNDELMLIVEFNGYMHYNNTKQILTDYAKNSHYKMLGYNVVEIPYFVQLTNDIVNLLFNNYNDKHIINETSYKHGFHDKYALLPCDFNSLGLIRFYNDLNTFAIIKHDIIESLEHKSTLLGYDVY